MNVGERIQRALSDLAGGSVWMNSCPKEESEEEYIVYFNINEAPGDFGDDRDLEWISRMMVHWVHKGNVNYYSIKKELKERLRKAGFTLEQIESGYDDESKTTHVLIICSIIEEE